MKLTNNKTSCKFINFAETDTHVEDLNTTTTTNNNNNWRQLPDNSVIYSENT